MDVNFRPVIAFWMRAERNLATGTAKFICSVETEKKSFITVCRSARSQVWMTGSRSSSVLPIPQLKLSRQKTRRSSKLGLPHSRCTFEESTKGFAYASITATEGKSFDKIHLVLAAWCYCLKISRWR